jgi:hypothetical protein
MRRVQSKIVKSRDETEDPVRRARREAPPTDPAVDWSKYRQEGPSCDMDTNGDPVPPKVRRR